MFHGTVRNLERLKALVSFNSLGVSYLSTVIILSIIFSTGIKLREVCVKNKVSSMLMA